MSYLDFLFLFHSPLQDTLHLTVMSLEVPLGCGSLMYLSIPFSLLNFFILK